MSIEDFKNSSFRKGNKYANIWEIQLQVCDQTHGEGGEGKCNASRENEPCRGTYKSCQDRCNFKCKNESYFIADCDDKSLLDIAPQGFLPIATNSTTSSGEYSLCSGAPSVQTHTLKIEDFRGSDRLFDPYLDRRTKDPKEHGLQIEKWLKSNDFTGRLVTHYYGACGSNFPNSWIKRNYFIDSINGPSGDNCQYSIKMKDPFSLISGSKRTIPPQFTLLKTETKLVSYSTSVQITGLQQAHESLYRSSLPSDEITICIDDVVMTVTQAPQESNNANGSIFNIIESGLCGSEKLTGDDEIDIDADVIIARRWRKGTNIVNIIFDIIFQDGVGIPSAQGLNFLTDFTQPSEFDIDTCCGPFLGDIVDIKKFRDLASSCANQYVTDDIIICTPTDALELLNEIAQSYLISPYIDDCTGLMSIAQFRPPPCGVELPVIEECQMFGIKGKNLTFSRNRSKRFTQVSMYSEPSDCTKGTEELPIVSVHTSIFNLVDNDNPFSTIPDCDYAGWQLAKEKKIRSRFFRGCNKQHAHLAGGRILHARKDDPYDIKFSIHGKDLCFGKTDFILVRNSSLFDYLGCPSNDIYMVTSVNLSDPCSNRWEITAESTGFKEGEVWTNSVSCGDGDCSEIVYNDADYPSYEQVEAHFQRMLLTRCAQINRVFNTSINTFLGPNAPESYVPSSNDDYEQDDNNPTSDLTPLYECRDIANCIKAF